ncbi:PIN domain-containing protein [Nitratifractor salsuginis]|uniref:PilT protein domain protein n=1 Tax=Nitratifractor salsuginis (strain DSM 16511 / JCM 12458 / E9I37-1) TaxID=749222 RepID=E6X1D9_NITSE|nr:PIN domain-containing protein [Nitratifractor salsuginis]ADV45872.1 PilT protein domain protein [Nitratifractor salsuginis DSM 16511]
MVLLDANYILRYLLNDNADMFRQAVQTIENEECFVPGEVLGEVIYVLSGHYGVPRSEVADVLEALLALPNLHSFEDGVYYEDALRLFAESSLDYVDCLLCSIGRDYRVATFDKKLLRCLDK